MNLVFTSAGDNTRFDELWLDSNRTYKVWVVYYGDDDEVFEKYKSKVDYIERRKGSKFQNFYHIWKTKDLSKFDRFFILDDDIIINTNSINKMFRYSEYCNLSICAPAFDRASKISWRVTMREMGSVLRFTNWVEVNTPLFNRESLENLMEVYDESLIGWGIDYLYIWANGEHRRNAYAIIDDVVCTNPKDERKGGKRELELVDKWDIRSQIWEEYREKLKIPHIPVKKTWWCLRESKTGFSIFQNFTKNTKPQKRFFSDTIDFQKNKKDKIAFLFLTVGDINQPKFWADFLKEGSDRSNIYVHSKFKNKLGTAFLRDNQIEEHFDSFWGGPGLVLATIALIKEALKDPTNKYFVLVSDGCLPLFKFDYIYDKLINLEKSMINFTKSPIKGYEQYINLLLSKNDKITRLKKCSQWMGLNRKHAEIVGNIEYEDFDKAMIDVPIPDEWFFRSLLEAEDPNFIENNIALTRITYREFSQNRPKIFKKVNFDDFQKKEGIHELFIRKVCWSTRLNYNQLE